MTLLKFSGACRHNECIAEWFADHQSEHARLAALWFRQMRNAGPDVLELLHDGYPTVCVADCPFAYVGTFKAHTNVGFFYGAELTDPAGILQGTGKRMRHVKLKAGENYNSQALNELIQKAYQDIKLRIEQEQAGNA